MNEKLTKHRLLIADDHVVIASGVKLLLNRYFNFEAIIECNNLEQIVPSIKTYGISHLILDVAFPNESSIPYLESIYTNFPNIKMMLFTMHPKHLFINTLEQYPQLLFCQKNASEEDLIKTVKNMIYDELATNSSFASQNLEKQQAKLSKMEERVLQLLLDGKTTNEIASILNLKSNTVSTYKRRIFDKTQTSNIMQLSKIFR
jgi:DNA-binding NarL/FixJ family response regulator